MTYSDFVEGGGLFSSLKKLGLTTYKKAKATFSKLNEDMFNVSKKAYQKLMNTFNQSFRDGNRSRHLELGELHIPRHNFTGPGTRMDLEQVRNFKPFNDIDACSKQHDMDYETAKTIPEGPERARFIQAADSAALDCYDENRGEHGYLFAKAGIGVKFQAEKMLSMLRKEPSVFYGGKRNIHELKPWHTETRQSVYPTSQRPRSKWELKQW